MAKRDKPSMPPITEELLSRFPSEGDFQQRLLDGLKIPGFGPVRHLIRRGDQARPTEFFPDRCWSIVVMPSFGSWGMFAVFESRSLIRCAFVCRGDLPDKPDSDYAVVDCFFEIGEWSDPVLDLLSKGPLAPTPDRSYPEGMMMLACDGIGYRLHVVTADVSATIGFSNPRGGHYRSIERAACDLARSVARRIAHSQVSSFVKTWTNYVRE